MLIGLLHSNNFELQWAISKAVGLQQTIVWAIIHKWRKLGTMENLPRTVRLTKITPRVCQRLIQEVTKEPRTTSKELRASLASVKVRVHHSTVRKTGQKRHSWESSQVKTTADTKEHKGSSLICQKASWWTSRLLERLFVCGVMSQKFLDGITVKHGGGSMMLCGYLAASGPG